MNHLMNFDYHLSRHKLKRLTEHKYSVEGTSILEPFLQPFWCKTVEYLPLWCAPNAVTLTGLIINAVCTLLLVYYSPDARGSPPAYSYVLCALGLFLYQTLDAIDGKQARRTRSSSPLGELFDHGCDSVSIVLVMVSCCIMLRLGDSSGLMFFHFLMCIFIFYAAHWQTYCSGTLKFGLIDVTEAQLMMIGLLLMTSCVGTSFWATELPFLGVEMRLVVIMISVFASTLAALSYFPVIFIHGGVGRNGSTVAGTSVLSPIFPMALLISLSLTLWLKSSTQVFDDHSVLYVLSIGMVSAKITNKLVVAHMTCSEMEMFDRSFIGLGLLFLNQYFDTFFDEYILLWVCFLFGTADLLWYSIRICDQICTYFNIRCFHILPVTVPANPDHPRNTSADSTPSAPTISTSQGDSSVTAGYKSSGHSSLSDRRGSEGTRYVEHRANGSSTHSPSSSSSDSGDRSIEKRVTRSTTTSATSPTRRKEK